MRFLIGAGCEQAQGYYFSRPVPVARVAELLREGRIEPGAASRPRSDQARHRLDHPVLTKLARLVC